jgi:ribosomal protein S18 acetylase RimI-like enzyme
MDIAIRAVSVDEWPHAQGVLHRGFLDEPFVHEMYGDDIVARWGGSWSLYASMRHDHYGIALGAFAGQALVGVLIGSVSARCHLCSVLATEPLPQDPHDAIDWVFHQNVATVHIPLGQHAWIQMVAVEPELKGRGIGRQLVRSISDAVAEPARVPVLLECQSHRQGFYKSLGFDVVTTFPDPAGPDALLMSRWIGG